MDAKILISVEQLYRYYGHHLAVEAINFELAQGEVLGFLGPNGAGKSTTMQMISGNLAPSAGRIRINGIDLLDTPKRAKAEIGYLPEQPPVYRDLTVDEYYIIAQNCIVSARAGAARLSPAPSIVADWAR